MTKTTLILLTFLLTTYYSFGQTTSEVIIPKFNDKYSGFVKQLEAGEADINYREFRESFIESEQFKVASNKSKEFERLEKEMYVQMDKSNSKEIIGITKAMLSIDYTSMIAHKILRQTYNIIGDTLNAKKYKTIQFGLLYSIIDSGDGNTCESAWHVTQVNEEYFILQMLGVDLITQSILTNNVGLYDKMEVKAEDGSSKTYYFDVNKVFEGYKKLGMK
ncbi:DUF4919 domain-containing protein [uncultured Bacteroides sp.]|uniref:DUF4919 domain-containing protein n=1 Tax=uncultured Bacteroides sp. TaxID=162156 RepID=UPI002AA92B74|nr:DUF4919 domain-containing protein [uncultured Bacteroides sp.]